MKAGLTGKLTLLFVVLILTAPLFGQETGRTEALPLPAGTGGLVGPSFKAQAPAARQVLVGLRINQGDVIDGLVPLYASLDARGSLGRPTPGPALGAAGNRLELVKPGYVLAGIEGYIGRWYGADAVKQLRLYWRPWTGGSGLWSPFYGLGQEKNDKGKAFKLMLDEQAVAVGLYGSADDNGLGPFSLLFVRLESPEPGTRPEPVSQTPPQTPVKPQTQPPVKPQTTAPTQPIKPQVSLNQPGSQTAPPVKPQNPAGSQTVTKPDRPDRPEQPLAGSGTNTVQTAQPNLFRGLPSGQENVPSSNPALERDLLDRLNRERQRLGLNALIWDEALARAARYHAGDMASDGYFDHSSFDPDGQRVCGAFERIRQFSRSGIAENLARKQPDARAVLELWLASPPEKANLSAARSARVGIGFVSGLWVAVFGR